MNDRLNAGDVCTRQVTVADAGMPVYEAARLMREQHVGCLVVVERTDRGASPIGMLTDRDIVTAVVAREMDPALLRVGDVMTTDLATVHASDSLVDVIALMHGKGVRRVPVVAPGNVLAGLVTLDDLLVVLSRQFGALAQAIGGERRREHAMRP